MATRIGITTDFEDFTDNKGFNTSRYFLNHSYAKVLANFGAYSYLLPCLEKNTSEEYLEQFDGFIIPGGNFDISPELYGEKLEKETR
jgi:gamma-glutamyl-gamma-aminobutyrate hydrolase PuuD